MRQVGKPLRRVVLNNEQRLSRTFRFDRHFDEGNAFSVPGILDQFHHGKSLVATAQDFGQPFFIYGKPILHNAVCFSAFVWHAPFFGFCRRRLMPGGDFGLYIPDNDGGCLSASRL